MDEKILVTAGNVTALQKQFNELYGHGVVGVMDSGVQLDGEGFRALMVGKPIAVAWNGTNIEVSGVLDSGVRVLALI